MIIKSKSRKIGNFDQLYDYMKKGAEKHTGPHVYSRNVYAREREGILKEFTDNAELFTKRKNSVYMYHEIISITRTQGLSVAKQQAALHQIVQEYVECRAKNNLVWGYMHNDAQTNLHFHLMISSNERGSHKNLRLSRKDFDESKKHLESWTNTHYPELKQGIVINKKAQKKRSQSGVELEKRTGHLPERERVSEALKHIFSNASSKAEFFDQLSAAKLEIYTRGQQLGFVDSDTGRKYRLATLGLGSEFTQMSQKIELETVKHQTKQSEKTEPLTEEKSQAQKPEKSAESTELKPESKEQKAKNALQQQRAKSTEKGKTKK